MELDLGLEHAGKGVFADVEKCAPLIHPTRLGTKASLKNRSGGRPSSPQQASLSALTMGGAPQA